MKFRRALAVAVVALTAFTMAACGDNDDSARAESGDSIVDKAREQKRLTVGIKFDQPGLGLKEPDGSYSGFDVEIARIVAGELGVPADGITFVETVTANREAFIEQGQVDLVVATYSITDTRKEKVSFAGPYFIAGQSLLVRADTTDITGPESLDDDKKLCSVKGSTPAQRIKDEYAKDVQLQEFDSYSKCVEALRSNAVDALTTDDIILAGFAAAHPGQFRVVGDTFSIERYGIGLKKNDTRGRAAINDAIEKAIADGRWKTAFESTVGPSGYALPDPPQVDRY